MKAKDYYEQYGEAVLSESYHDDEHAEIGKMAMAFIKEMKEILEERHISTDRGAVSVIKEQNEKWNALCSIFEKRHGVTPLKRNGFMSLMELQIPELKGWQEKWGRKS